MSFIEVIDQVIELLRNRERISYRVLKREFGLDDEQLEDLKEELIDVQELAADKDGKMLVWTGDDTPAETSSHTTDTPAAQLPVSAPSGRLEPERSQASQGERRQLTVMFCDLVGSTALSEQLDPEELQTIVRTYQEVSAQIIERYEGYIAQYLGDGLLVYFGYPVAHEEDAPQAIRAGLELVTALHQARHQFLQPVPVRIGIHTGPVVVGQMGGGERHEQLALGETPNIAARVQGKAQSNAVVISAATQHLVAGLFEIQDLGRHVFKGISTPQQLYQVTAESATHSRFEVAAQAGLTPLIGRENELGVLQERWLQAQAGAGQVVLLSGEPGIGKSRLVQQLKDQVAHKGTTQIAFRCSPYHQNSALYPITEHLQRLLQFVSDDTPQSKLAKLQQLLERYRFPRADTLPLFATLLSLPHPESLPSLTVSPQKQKERTQTALVAWLVEETEQQAIYMSWEDLHWADPSSLEVLDLLLRQVPTIRLLAVLTFRPEFISPWGTHSYLSQLTLSRLGQPQVNVMVEQVTGGKRLPDEILQQIVTKTDGIPLFVEELTKMVLESDFVREEDGQYTLTRPLPPLAIPSTLQDSLRARLDRLEAVGEVAQLGAAIGHEFSYELLQAVSPLEEESLQQALQQLVDAEFLYQRGLLPQTRYTFRHVLIQDTAYQSLLKRTRQHYHQQIAQVLEAQFTQTDDAQPELVAHHYTEAGFPGKAIPYWQQAGQTASQRSANVESIIHLTQALELLETLPQTSERDAQELPLQLALAGALTGLKGFGPPEVEKAYSRARELCQQMGETAQLFPVLWGLESYYMARGEIETAHTLGEQCFTLAQGVNDAALLLQAHLGLGREKFFLGDFSAARDHLTQGAALYDRETHHGHAFIYRSDPGVECLMRAGDTLWYLGYPDQSLQKCLEALRLAREVNHIPSIGVALNYATLPYFHRREVQGTQEKAAELVALGKEHGFALALPLGRMFQGWVLTELGHIEAGIEELQQGLEMLRATGTEVLRPFFLLPLAEAYGKAERPADGRVLLNEVLPLLGTSERHFWAAEVYRVTGELSEQEKRPAEAETSLLKALDVAHHQQAKSLELRAATSLARLWQQQGKPAKARELLAPVYDWFTEGFDTQDLKEAKALLDAVMENN
jgi:class 3 adenylate cyclase/predicted ATPase